MGLFYAMCGIPGCGRTTYALNLLQDLGGYEGNIWYICPDEIRRHINGDEGSQANMALVWELVYFAIQCAITSNGTIILDATNGKKADRERLTHFVGTLSNQYDMILCYLYVPLGVAIKRNAHRTSMVPLEVLIRYQNSLKENPPQISEGWASIRFIPD